MSVVWKYFEKVSTNPELAKCLLCNKNYSRKGRNTTNLKNHLMSMHSEEYKELTAIEKEVTEKDPLQKLHTQAPLRKTKCEVKTKNQTLFSCLKKKKICDVNDSKTKKLELLDYRIAEMLIMDALPFSHVEDVGFMRLMNVISPQYKLKTRKFYRDLTCDEVYAAVSRRVKEMLLQLRDVKVSFTTSVWSDTSAGVSLLSLTCHAITSNFERMELVLGAHSLHEQHTGEYCSKIFDAMLVKWGINQSSIQTIMRDSKALFISGIKNLDCTAHMLQIIVKTGLESQKAVIELISKVRSIAAHFHHSTVSQDELKKIQDRLNKPILSVVHDIPTRWNSMFLIMERVVDLKEPLSLFFDDNSKIQHLTKLDFDLLAKCVCILKPFDAIIKQLSGPSASISEVIPLIEALKHTLKKTSLEEDHGVKIMMDTIYSELDRRFEGLEGNDNYSLATYLDPKFKSKFFSPADMIRLKNRLGILCDELTSQPATKKMRIELAMPVIKAGSSSQDEPGATLIHKSVTILLASSSNDEYEPEISQTSKDIIECYHKEKRIGQGDNSLLWWKANQSKYYPLSMLARSYLSCPPTSVPSEHLFSGAAITYDKKLSHLNDEMGEKLLFLKYCLPCIQFKY